MELPSITIGSLQLTTEVTMFFWVCTHFRPFILTFCAKLLVVKDRQYDPSIFSSSHLNNHLKKTILPVLCHLHPDQRGWNEKACIGLRVQSKLFQRMKGSDIWDATVWQPYCNWNLWYWHSTNSSIYGAASWLAVWHSTENETETVMDKILCS